MKNDFENNLSGIDKYSGSFEQDELGVTQIPTTTIQLLNDFTLLGLFTFLASCPSDWKMNAKFLAKHFKCNKDKIYAAIDGLIEFRLLSRKQIRDKGKFVRYHYRLHLRQIAQLTPCLEKPDTVKPDTENPDTYKTLLLLKNKECITTTTVNPVINAQKSNTDVVRDIAVNQNPTSSSFFSDKQKTELLALKHPTDNRTDKEFLEHCQHHYEIQTNDLSKYQRITGLKNLLRKLCDNDEHFQAKGLNKINESKILESKIPTEEDFNQWKSCVSGYEWVGAWRQKQNKG